uniref:Deoxynucleotidyltransferase terminal-interacting protein 2 n=1 Tax=Aceria tosichella TaxID=561515 RepID=A0A6G1SKU7_9ACAR
METLDRLIGELTEEINVKPKRVVNEGFEKESKLESVKSDMLSRSERKQLARKRREATLGPKWFDMPTKELTYEDKLTVDAIKLRETLDPTKFYKKKATDQIGKNFQVGTVIEHPMDYYSSRATRKERKQTLIDELIADAEFKKNVKKRFRNIKATNAIKKKEKALAERRRAAQAKKKSKKTG